MHRYIIENTDEVRVGKVGVEFRFHFRRMYQRESDACTRKEIIALVEDPSDLDRYIDLPHELVLRI